MPPATIGVAWQIRVATIAGAVAIGHVEVALLVTGTPQRLNAFAIKVLVVEQFSGTV